MLKQQYEGKDYILFQFQKIQERQNVCLEGGKSWPLGTLAVGHVGAFCSTEGPLTPHRAYFSHAHETMCCFMGVHQSALFKWVYFLYKNSISINTSLSQ